MNRLVEAGKRKSACINPQQRCNFVCQPLVIPRLSPAQTAQRESVQPLHIVLFCRLVSCCKRCCSCSQTTPGGWACWAPWNGGLARLGWRGSIWWQASRPTQLMWPTCTLLLGWSWRKGTCKRPGSFLQRAKSWSPTTPTSCRFEANYLLSHIQNPEN